MMVSCNDNDEVLILTLLGQNKNMDQMRKGKAKKSFRIELITKYITLYLVALCTIHTRST